MLSLSTQTLLAPAASVMLSDPIYPWNSISPYFVNSCGWYQPKVCPVIYESFGSTDDSMSSTLDGTNTSNVPLNYISVANKGTIRNKCILDVMKPL